jgi:S-DNA-T family DNA segregation ATPase FtsK/SpoIIIE
LLNFDIIARRSRKKITYDSKESKVLAGLFFLALGVLSMLSLFVEGKVFEFFRGLVYNEATTVLMSIWFFNISLNLFRSKFILTKKKSLFGQFLIIIGLAGFITSIFGAVSPASLGINPGGLVGYYVFTFLNDNLFFNFTPVVFMVILIFAIPFTLVMPIGRFLDILGLAIQRTGEFIVKLMVKRDTQPVQAEEKQMDVKSAATFGDFQKNINKSDANKQQDRFKKPDVPEKIEKVEKKEGVSVAVKEDSVEGVFMNAELQYPDWKFPPMSILNPYKKVKPSQEKINRNADIIEKTLTSFGIKAQVVDVIIGPSVTQYALDVALGVKVNKIANLIKDLALALATPESQVRLQFPIPGTSFVGIEIPNPERETVYLKETFSDAEMQNSKFNLPVALGKNIAGKMVFVDLQKMPHVLIAGATGSGKSILTNGFIMSLLFNRTPDEVKFIMVDPKQVELAEYNGIPYLLTPVITEMDKVLNALKWAISEMEQRYTIFRESHVKNIESYNQMKGYSALPYIVIVIDEMADMMMSTNKVETESAIVRLAQKARATGIHLILATQRPSVNVITGLIKANIPGRIGMSVTTRIDSQVILDQIGAESLLGKGDLLFKDPSSKDPSRIQGMWVSPEEILRTVEYIKSQVPEVHYTKEVTEARPDDKAKQSAEVAGGNYGGDEQFANAVRVVVNAQKGSTSLIQRKLALGYNRAARLLDKMEELGVVGPENGSKPRDVYINDSEEFLQKLADGEIGIAPTEN